MRPSDLRYSESHEWVKVSGKDATIGITDYAVSQLSDLVHIDLPKVGDSLEQGGSFGEIESVKTVAELLIPVGGKILEVHKEIAENLDVIVDDPFGEGWLIKVKLSNPSEVDSLMKSKEYAEFIKTSESAHGGGDDDENIDEEDLL
ncbi:MAG: glycine cleavage system protein H [Planctomycetes bacterium RBG_16_59_8]|nr:MAG: glycine cleavage system protein H [Planctomycetes bacterium RBG_16_59_8]